MCQQAQPPHITGRPVQQQLGAMATAGPTAGMPQAGTGTVAAVIKLCHAAATAALLAADETQQQLPKSAATRMHPDSQAGLLPPGLQSVPGCQSTKRGKQDTKSGGRKECLLTRLA